MQLTWREVTQQAAHFKQQQKGRGGGQWWGAVEEGVRPLPDTIALGVVECFARLFDDDSPKQLKGSAI